MSRAGVPGRRSSRRASRARSRTGSSDFARPRDAHAVAFGQQVVERAVLEVRRQQPREPLGGQVDLLEQQRLAVGEAQPLEVERRRAELEPEGVGDGLARGLGSGRDQPRRRIETAESASPR